MPPALHPRSVFTTSLFTTTLALSFVVVGLPHLIPCPANTNQYAEGQMKGLSVDPQQRPQRKRRRIENPDNQPLQDSQQQTASASAVKPSSGRQDQPPDPHQSPLSSKRARECPVPKPGGLVGQILGFNRQPAEDEPVKPTVKIKAPNQDLDSDQHGKK